MNKDSPLPVRPPAKGGGSPRPAAPRYLDEMAADAEENAGAGIVSDHALELHETPFDHGCASTREEIIEQLLKIEAAGGGPV